MTALPTTTWAEDPPVLVKEVLSPSTRVEDTVVKSSEHAAAGVGQFRVVDPDHRTIDVHVAAERRRELALHIDDVHPTGEVGVGDHVVALSNDEVLPAPS